MSRYGYHATLNSYFICRDPVKTNRIFSTLRFGNPDTDSSTASPASLNLPTHLGGFRLTSLRDLTVGYDSSNPPTYEPKLPVDRSAHMLSFSLGDTESGDGVEAVGTVRTSGTEPKVRRLVAPNRCCAGSLTIRLSSQIKYYLEARGANRQAVRAKLEHVRDALGPEWLRAEQNGLEKPE